jgi:hypothetical protein
MLIGRASVCRSRSGDDGLSILGRLLCRCPAQSVQPRHRDVRRASAIIGRCLTSRIPKDMAGIWSSEVEASDFRARKCWVKSQIGEVQHGVEGDHYLGLCHVNAHAHVRSEADARQRSHRALEPQVYDDSPLPPATRVALIRVSPAGCARPPSCGSRWGRHRSASCAACSTSGKAATRGSCPFRRTSASRGRRCRTLTRCRTT